MGHGGAGHLAYMEIGQVALQAWRELHRMDKEMLTIPINTGST
jgi:hypothetical protein